MDLGDNVIPNLSGITGHKVYWYEIMFKDTEYSIIRAHLDQQRYLPWTVDVSFDTYKLYIDSIHMD